MTAALLLWRAALALELENLADRAGRDGYAVGGVEGEVAYSIERDLRSLSVKLRTLDKPDLTVRFTTAADRLRELLATKPAHPNDGELARWFMSSTELLPLLLGDLADVDRREAEFRVTNTRLRSDLEGIDADLVAERAAHRRTMDERAKLRHALTNTTEAAAQLGRDLDAARSELARTKASLESWKDTHGAPDA